MKDKVGSAPSTVIETNIFLVLSKPGAHSAWLPCGGCPPAEAGGTVVGIVVFCFLFY